MVSVTGVAEDWINELNLAYALFTEKGPDATAAYLRSTPVKTYRKRMEYIVGRTEDISDHADTITYYSVNNHNKETVKKIDQHVYLLNLAAREGRLNDRMFRRLFNHLRMLVYGDNPPLLLGEESPWI